jgi:flagellar biosynthesis protein FlhG
MASNAEAVKTESSEKVIKLKGTASGSRKVIWSIGGGKGGVGKSFISSSLSITLAQQGHKVVLVDLDLGGANVHTCLGHEIPPSTLSDYISGRCQTLKEIVTESSIKNLSFISGANDALNVANLKGTRKESLMREIRTLDFDYVILDLGAGTADNTLDFFLMADKAIVGFVPEPTSIENAYRFIKSAFYRKLKNTERALGLKQIVDEAMDHKNHKGIRTPADLLRYVSQTDPVAGEEFRKEVQSFKLYFLMNQVRTRSDVEVGLSIQSVCRRYFGIESDYAGYLDYDNAVWQALRRKRPLLLEFPYSLLVGQFAKIAKYLVDPIKNRAML